jgi:hypothetical protein
MRQRENPHQELPPLRFPLPPVGDDQGGHGEQAKRHDQQSFRIHMRGCTFLVEAASSALSALPPAVLLLGRPGFRALELMRLIVPFGGG